MLGIKAIGAVGAVIGTALVGPVAHASPIDDQQTSGTSATSPAALARSPTVKAVRKGRMSR
jgi:hypothetical protein